MNSKMLLAFVGGLIVASGVTYIAMKRNAPVAADTAQANIPAPVAAQPKAAPAEAQPAPESPVVESESKPVPARPRVRAEPVKRPPVHRTQYSSKLTEQAAVRSPNPIPQETAPAPVQATPQPAPPMQEVAKVELPQPPPYEPPPATPHTVTIPAGTMLNVRLSETLTTERNQPGDQFTAVLDQPLVIDGFVIAERGARAQGRIVELERSGKVRGLARMALELTQVKSSDGQNLRIRTTAFNKQAETTKEKDATKVGGGAALGAIIGAIAGGGKGAAIGAGAGGAVGAGDVMLTRGKPAELRVETRIGFRISEAVTITERLQ